MGLVQRFAGAVRGFMASAGGRSAYDPNDPRWWQAAGGAVSFGGQSVTRAAARALPATQAVLGGVSRTIKVLPRGVYRRRSNNSREALPEHPLALLLRRAPNGWQTPAEFLGEMAADAAFDREFLAEIRTDADGVPVALERVAPHLVDVRWEEGRRRYRFRRRGQAALVDLRDDAVLHLTFGPMDDDQLRAVPLWRDAPSTFARAIAVETYGQLFFGNSGKSGNYLVVPPTSFKNKEERQAWLQEWREQSTGGNAHKDKMLFGGMDVKPGEAPKNNEAQFLETLAAADASIFGLFGYPPHMAARLDRATFSNIEHQNIEFVTYCLLPLLEVIEQGLDRWLIPEPDTYVKFNADGLLRGDVKSRGEFYHRLFQAGALSPNDIREMEERERLPGLDRHFFPTNGAMIDPATGEVEAPPAPAREPALDAPSPPDPSDGDPSALALAIAGLAQALPAAAAAIRPTEVRVVGQEIKREPRFVRITATAHDEHGRLTEAVRETIHDDDPAPAPAPEAL